VVVVVVHPLPVDVQHHTFFSSVQRLAQFQSPALQSKGAGGGSSASLHPMPQRLQHHFRTTRVAMSPMQSYSSCFVP